MSIFPPRSTFESYSDLQTERNPYDIYNPTMQTPGRPIYERGSFANIYEPPGRASFSPASFESSALGAAFLGNDLMYGNAKVNHLVNVAPYRNPDILDSFEKNQPVFVNVARVNKQDVFCANVQSLNYLLEQGYRSRANGALNPLSHLTGRKKKLGFVDVDEHYEYRTMKDFFCVTEGPTSVVQSFEERWRFYGVLAGRFTDRKNYGPHEMQRHSVTVSGVAQVHNLFGPNVRRGDRVYLVAKEYKRDMDPTRGFVGPKGTLMAETSRLSQVFQVRGMSSADDGLPRNTGRDRKPEEDDVDFIEKDVVLKAEGYIYEDDPDNPGGFIVRSTDDLGDIPDVVMDVYRQGSVTRLGVVLHGTLNTPIKLIEDAHRDSVVCNKLPKIEISMGL